MEEESKKKESKKIQLLFVNNTITTQLHVSLGFEQKLKKAMKFCRDKFQVKSCEVTRFFHQNKELFENDTPETSGLVNLSTIDVFVNDFNLATNIVVKSEPNEEEENQTPSEANVQENHTPSELNEDKNQIPTVPNEEENHTPINESNQDHQQPDSNLNNNMSPATNDDPPIEESSNTDEINSKTDDRAQENRDESIATIDSIQNLVQESAPNDNQQVDDSVAMDQTELIPESIHETVSHSMSSATQLDQIHISNTKLNVITDKNSKRNREDVNDTTEPSAKVIKMMDIDPNDSLKKIDMMASFLDDLASFKYFAIDPVKPKVEKHEGQIKREQIEIEGEIERRVASRIEEMRQTHNDELAEQQKKIMQQAAQLDELKQTHTAEIGKWKQNYGDLSEKYGDLVKKQEANMLAQQQALAMQNEADQNKLKMLYEGRLLDLQNKYIELEKSAEKQNAEMAARDSSIAKYTQELQTARSTIGNYKKHYDALKSNYDTLFKRDSYYSRQHSMLLNCNNQYQGQLKGLEDKYNALKKESEAKIITIQHERNDIIREWKAQQKACNELNNQMDLMKQENNARISQMRQELLMKLQNQVTVPTPISSPVSTQQPPESSSTPPPPPPRKERKCELCKKPRPKMAVTIPLCGENCKYEYFKQQYEQMKSKQADV